MQLRKLHSTNEIVRRVGSLFDGTNIASRDQGHMDKAIVHSLNDDRVTVQWTWYERGKEKWMEEIQLDRVPSS
jgi:hypothetical protein